MANLSSFVTGQSIAASIEKTYIKAPDSLFSSLWVTSGAGVAVSTETGAANLPEGTNKSTALKILRASGSDYVRYRFKLDAADGGKNFKLFWNQIYAGVAGDYTLSMFAYSDAAYSLNQATLTLDTSSVPSGTTSFYTTAAMPAYAVTPYIELRINGIAGTSPLYLSGIIVGPGNLMQGSVITDWQAYTPIFSASWGTTTNVFFQYRRVGSAVEVQGRFTAGTTTGVEGQIGIPTGLTIGSFGGTTTKEIGRMSTEVAADSIRTVIATTGNSYVNFSRTATAADLFTGMAPNNIGSSMDVALEFTVITTEWTGSGTTLVGPSAQVEYVYNSSTATAASDTSSFASGSQGALIGNITANLERRIRFTYPIQNDDIFIVELSEDRAKWQPLYSSFLNAANTQNIQSWIFQNGVEYGMGRFQFISATDVDISFGQYAFAGSTYGAAGTTWASAGGSTTYWRVRKAKAVAPVGISSSGSGGSGFTLSTKTANFTAATLNHYLVDTSLTAITGTLPAGASGSSIKFSDDARTWSTQIFTIQPATGEKLDGLGINESLICDVSGASVQLSWDGLKWVLDTNAIGSGLIVATSSQLTEKNYISKPDNAYSDWATSNGSLVTVDTEIVPSNIPENATKTTAVKVLRVSGTTGYIRIRMILDTVDSGKKFKIQWNQKYAGTAGDYTLQVFSFTASDYTTGSTQLTVQTSSIPTGNSTFVTTFDTPASTAPYIEMRIVAAAGTTPLYLSGVLVGPGIVTQGAAIGEWQSFTPTLTNGGTTSSSTGRWRRVGSTMEIQTTHVFTGAGAASTFSVSLPTGYTINTTDQSAGQQTSGAVVGTGQHYNGTTISILQTGYITSTTPNGICFFANGATNIFLGSALGNTHVVGVKVAVPISEWAGSGTLALGPGAQVEYAYNSSATATTDTTSFASGPQGALIQNFAPGGTSVVTKAIQWQYPIQSNDLIILEVDQNTGGARWVPAATTAGFQFHTNDAGSANYGTSVLNTSATVTWINFYSAPYAGASWSSLNTWRWRVRKVNASSPVGFGLADATNSGLLSAGVYNSSTGAYTFGPNAGLVNHNINGGIIGSRTGTTATSFAIAGGGGTNGGGLRLGANTYLNASTNTWIAISSLTGYTTVATQQQAAAGSSVFSITANYQDAQTAGAAIVTTNEKTIGSATAAGAWTLGDVSTTANRHLINGGIDVKSARSTFTANSEEFALGVKYNAAGSLFYIGASSTHALQFSSSGGGVLGSITQTGVYALGPLNAGANYSGQKHLVSGGLHAHNVTSADGSGRFVISCNGYYLGNTSDTARIDTTTGGIGIVLTNRTVNANPGLLFVANQPGTGLTTAGVIIGNAQHDGVWTLGPDSGLTTGHTIRANTSTNTATLTVAVNGGTARAMLLLSPGSGTDGSDIKWAGTGGLFFKSTSNAEVGSSTNAGAWTFGPSGHVGTHNFNGAIVATGDITAFSDRRLKSEITTITSALGIVQSMRGVSFLKDGQRGIGFIAQELLDVLPEAVREHTSQENYLSVAYGNVTAVLTEAVKELAEEVHVLRKRLDEVQK